MGAGESMCPVSESSRRAELQKGTDDNDENCRNVCHFRCDDDKRALYAGEGSSAACKHAVVHPLEQDQEVEMDLRWTC